LGRTGAEGAEDKPLPGNVRAYDIAGGSHALISRKGDCKHAYAVLDWHPVLRATLLMLNKWVVSEEAPPPSVLMTLRAATGDGSVLQAPKHFPRATIQVPIADMDGNAQGGIRLPDLEAPLGTHAAQNPPLSFACALGAAYVPFATTKEEREAKGDPRPSIRERYKGVADYKVELKPPPTRWLRVDFSFARMQRKSLPPPPTWRCRNAAPPNRRHLCPTALIFFTSLSAPGKGVGCRSKNRCNGLLSTKRAITADWEETAMQVRFIRLDNDGSEHGEQYPEGGLQACRGRNQLFGRT
jgi:hypothetical protein